MAGRSQRIGYQPGCSALRYGTSGGGIDSPVKHKNELKSELIAKIDELMNYVSGLGVDIDKIISKF